jgi:hypothetical protein
VSASASTVNNNSWYNVVVTVSSTTHISYLNGVSYATMSKSQTSYASTYYYFLGAGTAGAWTSAPGSAFYTGSISNFSYYNRALTATEILQNFNTLRGRFGL